jgi:hypothetical protein
LIRHPKIQTSQSQPKSQSTFKLFGPVAQTSSNFHPTRQPQDHQAKQKPHPDAYDNNDLIQPPPPTHPFHSLNNVKEQNQPPAKDQISAPQTQNAAKPAPK